MAVTISVSDSSSDVWMVQNRVYSEFSRLVIERNGHDPEVVNNLEMAEAFGGVSLDVVCKDQPDLAIRLRDAFRAVAEDIGCGAVTLPGAVPDDAAIRSKFSELSVLLGKFL